MVVPLPSDDLDSRSKSNSTNSLFSLSRNRDSYSSIVDQYLTDEEDHEDPHAFSSRPAEEPSALTLNYSSRGRRFSSVSAHAASQLQAGDDKLVFILVGLPASGKSTVSNHLMQYLSRDPRSAHLRCKTFNAGQVRRKLSCRGRPMMLANNSSEDLFNPKNSQKKEQYARLTLEQMFSDLDQDSCDVAIFDATNSTEQRRAFIFQQLRLYNADMKRGYHITPVVLQVSCTERAFIRFNIHNKTFNQDYFDKPYEFAVRDFAKRLTHYHSQYIPFTKAEFGNQVAEGRLVSEDNGLFWYSIINAGYSDASAEWQRHFPLGATQYLGELIKSIELFMESYSQIYARQYIQDVQDFAKGKSPSTQAPALRVAAPSASTPIRDTTDVPYASILNGIVSDDYFNKLRKATAV
ncbi:LAME_0B03576g1_1 [Lachancea meyersii CBS 8951]|uniref:LAME_0B03576g1_1 n=1 Tax=Lachancea meyersii CBS 8951 TaxID=1266667 RepID=A0A1G4IUC2_9SACH|nr:LAME_0B03576g1_1 [Lachancea meyersii CBS 8951]